MIYIEVPDMNDSMSTITIDGEQFVIRFTYNELGNYWSFGIYNIEQKPIIAMTKIVPNFPINHFFTYTELPDGVFGALSKEKRIERYSFIEGKAKFVYIPKAEMG